MDRNKLHPSVEQFREFVNTHPKLKSELRNDRKKLQEYYEKWLLLGEDDPFFDEYRSTHDSGETKNKSTDKKEWMNQFVQMVDQVNWDNINGHIHHLNGALGNLQTLVKQFQEMKTSSKGHHSNQFPFLKD
ncbi:spore coat protein YlbD [Thalassobacillus devorans]|uniref:spore coat protein YlbD n=1 Tax=Thalassobacillus devorans TaxID=279813 RepID=UPI0004B6FD6B|nr:spore coat protein YlbD [Thalassobacillus devorans]